MSIIRLNKFRGIAPRYASRQLGDFNAQIAENVDLWSRELRSIRSDLIVNNPSKSGDILSIFPLGGKWLHWNEDVDVAQSPLNVDDEGRIYYTGHYFPKSTNTELATVGAGTDYPLVSYRLGLPAPESGPAVAITGGTSGVPEVRSYCYTYVTEWGEEGPPSAFVEYTAAHNDATSWDLSAMDTAPLNTGSIVGAVVSGTSTTFETSAPHFLQSTEYVELTGIVGTGDLPAAFNDVGPLKIKRVDSMHFSIELAPVGAYTSGGTWTRESSINTANMTKRIYRTSLGVYKLVAEIPVAQTTYTDTVADDDLQDEIPGIDKLAWTSPRGDMKGITMMPGGISVGFYKNVLAFSPPYAPHAYPKAYELTLDYTIVSIAVIDNTLIVGTTGRPYIVTGYDPGGMTQSILPLNQSCISKRSMVAILNGAMYASPDGLVYIPTAGAPELITRQWLKEIDWRKYNPSSISACVYDDRYYGFFHEAGENNNESGSIVFDPSEPESTFTQLSHISKSCYADLTSDSLYYYDDVLRSIKQFGYGGKYESFEWLSKTFTTPGRINYKAALVRFSNKGALLESEVAAAKQAAVAAVDAGLSNGTIVSSGCFGGFMPGEYAVCGGPYVQASSEISSSNTLIFRLYADGVLKFEKIVTNQKAFSLPGGYRADTWEIRIAGNGIDVHEVMIATTKSELAVA